MQHRTIAEFQETAGILLPIGGLVKLQPKPTLRLEPRPWPGALLRIPPHGRTGRCYELDRGAPLGGRTLLGFGIKPEEVKMMLKDNPANLKWLDERDAATFAPATIAGYQPQRT
jgi:hypothetical protein